MAGRRSNQCADVQIMLQDESAMQLLLVPLALNVAVLAFVLCT
jgi:hypothetical protein